VFRNVRDPLDGMDLGGNAPRHEPNAIEGSGAICEPPPSISIPDDGADNLSVMGASTTATVGINIGGDGAMTDTPVS
jgi:hypothetical protein